MTKSSFLAQLRRCLRWYCTPSETEEVLADYRDFFAAGLAEGRSEAELCEQFGSPEHIVRELAGGRKRIVWRQALAWLLMGASVLYCLYLGFGFLLTMETPRLAAFRYDAAAYFVMGLLVPALFLPLSTGIPRKLPERAGRTPRLPFLLIALGDLAVIGMIALLLYRSLEGLDSGTGIVLGPLTLPLSSFSPLTLSLTTAYSAALLLGLLHCLWAFRQGSLQRFPCVFPLLGAMYAMAHLSRVLIQIDNPDTLPPCLLEAAAFTAAGLLAGGLAGLLLGRKGAD